MGTIVDINGDPIVADNLQEEQTAKLGSLHSHYAGHPSRGLTPARLARILLDAEQGNPIDQFELFEDMEEKDPHIFSEMSKRRRAVMTLPWQIQPPRNPTPDEQAQADFLSETLQDLGDFEDLIFDMTDGIGKGFAAIEMPWRRVEKVWLPSAFNFRPQSWFHLTQTSPDIRLRDNTPEGAALNPFGWIIHTHKAKSGYLVRSALFRVLAWPFLFKNFSVRDLAEFLEIYGLPLRLGTYPAGADAKEKAKLLQAVISIGHDAAGIIPKGMEIDFKEAAKGSHDPFVAMMEWCEKSQSKAILGGTLTSQADGKSSTNALGNVHNEVRHDIKESDAKQLQGTLSRQLLYPILALNWSRPVNMLRLPRLVFDVRQPEDLKLYAESLPELVKMGMKIPLAWAHEKLVIPQAKKDDEVLAITADGQTPASLVPAAARYRMAALKAATASTTPTDELDDLTDNMLDNWQPVMDPVLSALQKLCAESSSLEDLLGRLPDLADIDLSKLKTVLENGAMTARIYGRVTGK